ncbi:MAG TPA: aminotransferase class I/II-fold pyridoxal phosphate-dependent enzyme [Longimicrobiales bacterium]|nr:aminotransferase class I/II-fold pyridoxal phosphate-dependent enzyme [Longimicrobiales bacterium]
MSRRKHPARTDAGASTLGVHGGRPPGAAGEPVVPPIVQSATFFGDGRGGDVLYTRYFNNPLQREVAQKLALLEGAEAAQVLGSGMAGIAMTLLALTQSGDHIVASAHLYGATRNFLENELPRRGVTTTFVDPTEGREWRQALMNRTRVLYLEAPTNPTLRVFDPAPIAQLAQEVGILLVMDATFATPINFRPLERGVDVVVHSATKYLGGHSDIIAGTVAGATEVVEEITQTARLYGPAADPHMVWLLDRGLRTLDARMERHNRNGLEVARFLEEHPAVERVLYPGLESHPDHALAARIMKGFGGMVSFVVAGGGKAANKFMKGLRLAHVAPSLGGVETLVSQPRYTSHAALSPRERDALGIPEGFVRLSVGIEDAQDLVRDLGRALDGL